MIYCVEDDQNIRHLITYTFKALGHDALGFACYEELQKGLQKELPELILLDIMLPKKDGLEILKDLKKDAKTKDIPVIMLTAKGSEIDKVFGLDEGADDYITKPFGMMELTSRVKAVLRRCNKQEQTDKFVYKNLVIDYKKHSVTVDSSPIMLSFKEYEVLKTLARNKGIVLSRDTLLNEVWGYDYDGENRTVDVHIRTLRAKLGEHANYIQTIRNVGYIIGE